MYYIYIAYYIIVYCIKSIRTRAAARVQMRPFTILILILLHYIMMIREKKINVQEHNTDMLGCSLLDPFYSAI